MARERDRSRHDRPGRSSQHRSRERTLTQAHPAKVRRSTDSIVLKDGSVFLVATESGDVPFGLPHGFGLFYRDCRYLDGWRLELNGAEPTVLSGVGVRGFETHHYLTNPDVRAREGRAPIPKNTIGLHRWRLLRDGVVHEILTVRNHGRTAAPLRLALMFRAKFEDVFVVKGFLRRSRGSVGEPAVAGDDRVMLSYAGMDDITRRTTIVFAPAPARLQAERATFQLTLAPGEQRQIAITITPEEASVPRRERQAAHPATSPDALRRWAQRSEDIWKERSASVQSPNPLFNRILERALLDLHLLRSRLDGYDYFAAGIPWFATLFGRDTATVALQTLPYGFVMAGQTLRLLARHQATAVDEYRDAAPGKILHEFRTGELAHIDAVPQSPAYYGSVDATLLFLMLAAEYVNWSGDLERARELRPNLDAALRWMDGHADADGDGYLDYAGRYGNGLVNQGWKDSGNAIVNSDGSLAEPPIALCEVQAYAYRAWRQMAGLLRRLEAEDAAEKLEQRAADLRARFDRDFWDEGLRCYVLARQAGGRPAAVVSSNAGQVLWGGLAPPHRAERIAQRLLEPDMFSGWGVRTLSRDAAAYNPMSYHLGSVWPHDNGLIVDGCRRYGQDDAALRIFDALFDAASHFRGYRLPELYCGYERGSGADQPIRYPVACSPQAWASGALPHALWSLLGLRPDAIDRRLVVRRPRLPAWLEWLELRGVRVGTARVDLRFHRDAESVAVDASLRAGDVQVTHTEEPSDPQAFD